MLWMSARIADTLFQSAMETLTKGYPSVVICRDRIDGMSVGHPPFVADKGGGECRSDVETTGTSHTCG